MHSAAHAQSVPCRTAQQELRSAVDSSLYLGILYTRGRGKGIRTIIILY